MRTDVQDFELFARDKGIGSARIEGYIKSMQSANYINPTVIEERQNANMINIDIFSRLLMDRILFLGCEVNEDVGNILAAQMLWLEQQSDADITLYINSPGGSVVAGNTILDTMDFIKNDISTVIMGMAASMAAVISSNGTRGKRNALPRARFMIHQPRMTMGKGIMTATDINIEAEEINKMKNELYKTLSRNSNLSYRKIAKYSEQDYWLPMDLCLKYGFIDNIISTHYGVDTVESTS